MEGEATVELYLLKAMESLEGATSEHANRRYNNCANRCYYACFQAAISALLLEGIRPRGTQWGHEYVQAPFAQQLVNRRHRYPAPLRRVLDQHQELRHVADYSPDHVTEVRSARALRRTSEFIEAIRRRRDTDP